MFQQFKNLDSAFKFVRVFAGIIVVASTAIAFYAVHSANITLQKSQQKIFVLSNGNLYSSYGFDRHDSLAVEVRDHVKMFHLYFYTLRPDEDLNKQHLTAALYLADSSAYHEYKNLEEKGYYSQIISGNISQDVLDYDSIQVDLNRTPYRFRYYGKIRMARSTSVLTRSLVTEGMIRDMGRTAISDRNQHGFLIENWKILDNRDLSLEKR